MAKKKKMSTDRKLFEHDETTVNMGQKDPDGVVIDLDPVAELVVVPPAKEPVQFWIEDHIPKLEEPADPLDPPTIIPGGQ